MATKNEELQWLKRQHAQAHGHAPATSRDVIRWAVSKGLYTLPVVDPEEIAADQLSRALREEYDTTKSGRRYRVNHSVRVRKSKGRGQGSFTSLWLDSEHGSHDQIELAFNQRREQTAGDCYQLYDDREGYQELHPDRPYIDIVFDFTEDILEREAGRELDKAA